MVLTIPELGLLSIKQWKACMSQCPFRHSFVSHCTAHIRTLDLHTFVSFALLAFLHLASHWCHSHSCLSHSCCTYTSCFFFALPNNGELLRRRLATKHVAHQHQKHHRGNGGDKVSIKLYVHNNAVTFGDHHHGSARQYMRAHVTYSCSGDWPPLMPTR